MGKKFLSSVLVTLWLVVFLVAVPASAYAAQSAYQKDYLLIGSELPKMNNRRDVVVGIQGVVGSKVPISPRLAFQFQKILRWVWRVFQFGAILNGVIGLLERLWNWLWELIGIIVNWFGELIINFRGIINNFGEFPNWGVRVMKIKI